ncbi:MAG: hypothetical protein ACLFPA_11210 [Dichotomicrobium sp.]
MKALFTVLSALVIVGAASAASADPQSEEFGSRAWWEEISNNG